MSTGTTYSGDVSRVNANDSRLCVGCQKDAPRTLLGTKGLIEYYLCDCGQHLMITGKTCGTLAFIIAIKPEEVPTDLVPASS